MVLSEFFGRFMRISCARSLSSVRLNIGEQSSLRLLFCQFAFLSLSFLHVFGNFVSLGGVRDLFYRFLGYG